MKRFACACVMLLATAAFSAAAETAVVRSNPVTYDVTLGASFSLPHGTIEFLDCALPLPETDQYQDASMIRFDRGTIKTHRETGGKYLYASLVGRHARPRYSASLELRYTARVTLYDIKTDFASLSVNSYHEGDALFRRYTSPNGKYIIPRHPRVARIAEQLKARDDTYIDFARKAYEYVADSFAWNQTAADLAELDDILEKGGGDSAALSSVYISLLRYRGIPARHVSARRGGGAAHVFAEFYVQDKGWIPVDVARRSSNPDRDYFGRLYARDRTVVVSRDIDLTISGAEGTVKAPIMSRFHYTHRVSYLADNMPWEERWKYKRSRDFYKLRVNRIYSLSRVN